MRNKFLFLIFFILITVTLSGCNDPYEYGEPVDMELLITEYELPQETEDLLLNNEIIDIFYVEGDYYVVYQGEEEAVLVSLDDELNIVYEINDFGYIYELEYDEEGLLIVTHHIESIHVDIIESDGTRKVSMNVSFSFGKTSINEESYLPVSYLSLDDGFYLYVEKTENGTNDTYKVLKTDGITETSLYEFESQYKHEVHVLSNDTIVFSYKSSTDILDTVIHMEMDGTIIKQEDVNLMDIELLSDGYLLELFGTGASYHHIRRDLSSNNVWDYTSDYLNFKEESDEYLFFTAHPNNGFDSIQIYNDGTHTTFIDEDDTLFPEHMRDYIDEDTFINIDYSNPIDDLYELTMYSKEEEILKQFDYTYRIVEFIKEDIFYIYGHDGDNTIFDIYNFDGELLDSETIEGRFVSITNDGDYVTVTEDGTLRKTSENGNLLWKVDIGFNGVSYTELYEDVILISQKLPTITSAFPNYLLEPAFIINDKGDIITDLTDKDGIGLISKAEDSFYMYQQNEKLLYQFNNSGIITQEFEIICYSHGSLYRIENGTLIIYEVEYIENPYSFIMTY